MTREEHAIEIAAKISTSKKFSSVNSPLILDIVRETVGLFRLPQLGCATTREMLDEIYTRLEASRELDYRSIETDEERKRRLHSL